MPPFIDGSGDVYGNSRRIIYLFSLISPPEKEMLYHIFLSTLTVNNDINLNCKRNIRNRIQAITCYFGVDIWNLTKFKWKCKTSEIKYSYLVTFLKPSYLRKTCK